MVRRPATPAHRRRGRRLAASLLSALGVAAVPGSAQAPAAAAGTTSGGATVTGTVTLTAFPCATVAYPPGCAGFFSGQVSATLSGTDSAGRPFTAVWPDPLGGVGVPPLNLSASFGYEEPCLSLPVLPPVGNASGQFTLSGGRLSVGTSGTTSGGAYVTGYFGWLRVGTVVQVQTWSTSLFSAGGTLIASSVLDSEGAATFVPNNGPGWCGNTSSDQTALIGGLDLVPE